jgi:hypothetical protein
LRSGCEKVQAEARYIRKITLPSTPSVASLPTGALFQVIGALSGSTDGMVVSLKILMKGGKIITWTEILLHPDINNETEKARLKP